MEGRGYSRDRRRVSYDGYTHPIQRADAARYFILFVHGGLYADLDYEPLINFWFALPATKPGFIESPYWCKTR